MDLFRLRKQNRKLKSRNAALQEQLTRSDRRRELAEMQENYWMQQYAQEVGVIETDEARRAAESSMT